MKKISFIILILLLVIGFAAISTTLVIKGNTSVAYDIELLNVIFTRVRLNNEESENIIITDEGKSFVYIGDDLININDLANIEYDIKNFSLNYDANVIVTCITDYEENIEYSGNTLEEIVKIEAGSGYTDNLIVKLIKENTSNNSIALKCMLSLNPIERDTIMSDQEYKVTFNTEGGAMDDTSITVKYYEKYGDLPLPTKEGYEFLGWYTDSGEKIDANSLVKIRGDHILIAKWRYICPYEIGMSWDFDYTGSEQEFDVPCEGEYKLETWGAQGGSYSASVIGGYGGYSVGTITLSRKKIYINNGGEGHCSKTSNNLGGYNGGGNANVSNIYYTCSGGGATHIALVSGLLSNLSEKKDNILLVSGGGGGSAYSRVGDYGNGGSAGGYIGLNGYTNAGSSYYTTGGSQNSSGCYYTTDSKYTNACHGGFGFGASLLDLEGTYHGGGGGSGYYGGGAVSYSYSPGGGGGSSYIGNALLTDKAMYCYNCITSNEESLKTISVTCSVTTPTSNCAKKGNGYTRITLVSIT